MSAIPERLLRLNFKRAFLPAAGHPNDPTLRVRLDEAWEFLIARYLEPHRRYHTLDHINELLLLFDQYSHLAENPSSVERALWDHDLFYDPKAKDNEERSAQWHENLLRTLEAPEVVIKREGRLIRSTAYFAPDWQPPTDRDTMLTHDLDLSPLAAPREKFDKNSVNVRFEFSFVSDEDYQKGRIGAMKVFLNRRPIFRLLTHLEPQATENLTRLIYGS